MFYAVVKVPVLAAIREECLFSLNADAAARSKNVRFERFFMLSGHDYLEVC